ncbi:MAG: hypothetical protein AOA66_0715 [Candidatus Bathyarchaeota archaeon BA2]|nr:MAG: hypothetical protein AOA66_0715 [Candidatus Bathyarchaeota archaeon BA2]
MECWCYAVKEVVVVEGEVVGHRQADLIYKYLEKSYSLRQDEIVEKIDFRKRTRRNLKIRSLRY